MLGIAWFGMLLGCRWLLPEPTTCAEPHLFYAADQSGDVYFGCEAPPGWLETPPDEASFGTAPRPKEDPATHRPGDERDEGEPAAAEVVAKRDTASVIYAGTGETGDTALPPEPKSARAHTRDTGPPSWSDTGGYGGPDTGATNDTGGPAPRRHRPRDTGVQDTGGDPAPQDTGALPPAQGDTGSP